LQGQFDVQGDGPNNSILIENGPYSNISSLIFEIKGLHALAFIGTAQEEVDLRKLRELQVLIFNHNPGSTLADNIFSGSKNLRSLIAIGNQFQGEFPVPILEKKQLQDLYVGKLYSLSLSSSRDIHTDFLKFLTFNSRDLSNNLYHGNIPDTIGVSFPRLAVLGLNGNSFSGGLPRSLKMLRYLTRLDVSHNELSKLFSSNSPNGDTIEPPIPRRFQSLSHFKANDNSIDDTVAMSNHFNLEVLEVLEVHNNPLFRFDVDAGNYASLRKINLQDVKLVRFHPHACVPNNETASLLCQISASATCIHNVTEEIELFNNNLDACGDHQSLGQLCKVGRVCTEYENSIFDTQAGHEENIQQQRNFSSAGAIALVIASVLGLCFGTFLTSLFFLRGKQWWHCKKKKADNYRANNFKIQLIRNKEKLLSIDNDQYYPSQTSKYISASMAAHCSNSAESNSNLSKFTTSIVALSGALDPSDLKQVAFARSGSRIEPNASIASKRSPPTDNIPHFVAEAVTNHFPDRGDEIALIRGDTILVEIIFEDGWAAGTNLTRNVQGVFPLVAVKPLVKKPTDQVTLHDGKERDESSSDSTETIIIPVTPNATSMKSNVISVGSPNFHLENHMLLKSDCSITKFSGTAYCPPPVLMQTDVPPSISPDSRVSTSLLAENIALELRRPPHVQKAYAVHQSRISTNHDNQNLKR
jgi:Leucine-rich repeat (LRR) protein